MIKALSLHANNTLIVILPNISSILLYIYIIRNQEVIFFKSKFFNILLH